MGVSWTEEQQKVIDTRGCNILVSAAAGSGKTAVLVERIIERITDKHQPIDIDRLLIVTFTRAAAGEMKERIRAAIEKRLEEDGDNEHLQRQSTLVHHAQITTIDSFCSYVVKNYFHLIDLDPSFRMGDEGEMRLLQADVADKVMEEAYSAENNEKFCAFADNFSSGKTDEKIPELIRKLYGFSMSYPYPEEWLQSCREAYCIETVEELEKAFWLSAVKEEIRRQTQEAVRLLAEAISLAGEPEGPGFYLGLLQEEKTAAEKIEKAETLAEYKTLFDALEFKRLPAGKKAEKEQVSERVQELTKNLRNQAKDLLNEIRGRYFSESLEEMTEHLRQAGEPVGVLVDLTLRFMERYREKKKEKNILDFADLEHYALEILVNHTEEGDVRTEAAKELSRQFAEIMIDEYQDSNLVQEKLLTSVSRVEEGVYNIFMVGDVKQSIYRFRLSRPEIFMDKYNTYDKSESKKQRIDLHKNFRSRKEVLDSVNFIFRQIMTEDLGGIDYDDDAALNVGADYKKTGENATEVLVVDTDIRDNDHKKVKGINEREIEARAIAGKIRSMMEDNFRVTDKESGKLRPLQYRDIVILTRSSRGFSDVFVEILGQEGIPAFAGTKEGYFATQEIGVLLDYLRVLDNARQDLPLTAVLTSPIGGCSTKELALIRSSCPEEPFYETVRRYRAEGTEEELRNKLENCLSVMEKIREIVPYTPMHELLQRVLDDTGYEMYMSAMPGGIQRKANIDMLDRKSVV